MPLACNSTLYWVRASFTFLSHRLSVTTSCDQPGVFYLLSAFGWTSCRWFISTSPPVVTPPPTTSRWEMLILISGFAVSAQTLFDHCAGLSIRLFPANQVEAEPMCQTCFIFMILSCAVSKSEYSRLGSVSNQMPHTFTAPAARIIQGLREDYAYVFIYFF